MDTNLDLLKHEWLQNEAPKLHRAFGHPSLANDQKAVWKYRRRDYDIKSAFQRYTTLEGHSVVDFDPAQCSWAQVFRLLAESQAAYKRKGDGISGSIRKALRLAGDHSEHITPLLNVIPDDIWGSALRAVLGWMFSLLATAAKNREKILAAFEDIPGIIITAEAKQKHFRGDLHIMDLVYNLFDTVIEVTTRLIAYLLPKHQIFKVFPWLTDAPSSSDVGPAIEKIQQAVVSLNQHSEILKESILVNINDYLHKATQEIQSELHVTRQQVAEVKLFMQQDSQAIKAALSSSEKETIKTINAARDELVVAANGARQGMWKMMDELINVILPTIQAREQQAEANARYLRGRLELVELQLERALTPLPSGPRAASAQVSIPDLQGIISAPFHAIALDFDYVLRKAFQADQIQQAQAYWVLQQPRFRQWISLDSSDILFVHGDLAGVSGDHNRISSLSAVCATMAASLVQTNSTAIGLYYFCGLHMSSTDALRGPQGLMRLLIGRLLVELDATNGFTPYLGFIDSSFVEGLRHRDMRYLCALFSSILEQFAQGINIYCMIDGVTWYERSDMRNDLLQVMQTLHQLVAGPLPCQLKILITSPFRSSGSELGIPEVKKINLEPEDPMLEASSGYMMQSNFGLVQTRMYGLRPSLAQMSTIPRVEEDWTPADYA